MANDIVPKLRSLKEDKLYEIIIFIEQLNHKLNKEYEEEVKRGIDCGIYDKNDRQNMKWLFNILIAEEWSGGVNKGGRDNWLRRVSLENVEL